MRHSVFFGKIPDAAALSKQAAEGGHPLFYTSS